jgi:hypothetical protein
MIPLSNCFLNQLAEFWHPQDKLVILSSFLLILSIFVHDLLGGKYDYCFGFRITEIIVLGIFSISVVFV